MMESNITSNIKPINQETIHKICSGQVVLSLAVAVKELVENSLDAGATNIEIRFKNYGMDSIEVSDNGTGVTEDNFAALTLKYHTSKLRDYGDLLGVSSFGFRGEALSSLCALSNLIITTRHKDAGHATKIEYDYKGNIIKKSPCSRQVGTTVSLTNLFSSLPVRQKEFHKNAKREFNKMCQLLYAYCLISIGVKITCSNQTSTNSKSVVVATQGSMSYKDNIACVFGLKQLQSILEIKPEYSRNIKENIFKGLSVEHGETNEQTIDDVEINLSEDSNDTDLIETQDTILVTQNSQGYKNNLEHIEFTSFISSCAHGSGRSGTDRQYFYVNSRPCEPTKIIKVINETYRQYNPNQYPFIFLNVNIERATVDVNVTPDKRKIFLTKEKIILEILRKSLLKLFEDIPKTVKIESSIKGFSKNEIKPNINEPRVFNSFLQQFQNKLKYEQSASLNKSENKVDLKRKSTTILDFVSSKSIKKSDSEVVEFTEKVLIDKKTEAICKETEINNMDEYKASHTSTRYYNLGNASDVETKHVNSPKNEKIDVLYLESDQMPDTQIRSIDDIVQEKSHTIHCNLKTVKSNTVEKIINEKDRKVVTDKEDIGKHIRKTITLKTSLEHIKQLANIFHTSKHKTIPERVRFKSTINPVHNKKCEEELSKEISKASFQDMTVIGQFNLGFIVTRLVDDLFIIDQHATDEIYNFEMLQKNTELTNQKLVIPQSLELTGVNEQILMDNLEVFKKNGFTFKIDENALPTKRVKLLTIPMSKNWIFGKEDIEELLFMLRESSSEYCRPSRVRAMFASRACRKSVMIGTALSKSDMKTLVNHMGEIDKPWNCPHGRPTIRHLVNLAMIQTNKS